MVVILLPTKINGYHKSILFRKVNYTLKKEEEKFLAMFWIRNALDKSNDVAGECKYFGVKIWD